MTTLITSSVVVGIVVALLTFCLNKRLKNHEARIQAVERARDAAKAIYEKYLVISNMYPDCVWLIGDTEEKLSKRLEDFGKALTAFRTELQSQELHLVMYKDKLINLREAVKAADHFVSKELQLFQRTRRPMNQPVPVSVQNADDAMRLEIERTHERLRQLEPLVKADFEFLINIPPPN